MMTRSKIWIIGYLIIVMGILGCAGGYVIKVDPFFHYHKPNTEVYFYLLNNQRSQNDGIVKHFDYDALITGTSMTENFRTTEMDCLFDVHSVKVPFSGGTYKEINDNLERALAYNPKLMTVIRSIDMGYFFFQKDDMRAELGQFPTYLYDDNILNDVKYIYNRDVIFTRVYSMVKENDEAGFAPGMTSFDNYSNWMAGYTFGGNVLLVNSGKYGNPKPAVHLTEEEKEIVSASIEQNVVSLARQYPNTTFYCFFPPYSAAWWGKLMEEGTIYKQIEGEELAIEQILECNNIKLYSFNNRTDITTDLNNYKDTTHYGTWVNSLILKWMYNEQYLLTKENYTDYLTQELNFYTSYDYEQLWEQTDYENDYFAEALLREELCGIEPLEARPEEYDGCELANVGIKVTVDEIDPYKYLVFYGEKNKNSGQLGVFIYNEDNEVVAQLTEDYNSDNEEHLYMVDVSRLTGKAVIIFDGAYADSDRREEAAYTFRDITLY